MQDKNLFQLEKLIETLRIFFTLTAKAANAVAKRGAQRTNVGPEARTVALYLMKMLRNLFEEEVISQQVSAEMLKMEEDVEMKTSEDVDMTDANVATTSGSKNTNTTATSSNINSTTIKL